MVWNIAQEHDLESANSNSSIPGLIGSPSRFDLGGGSSSEEESPLLAQNDNRDDNNSPTPIWNHSTMERNCEVKNESDDFTMLESTDNFARKNTGNCHEELSNLMSKLRGPQSLFYSTKEVIYYDDTSHLQIICQLSGSVWPNVWPYCLGNFALCFVLALFQRIWSVDLSIPIAGHSFLVILLAFLVVSRVQITYKRFMEARSYLGGCFQACRELMQYTCFLTLTSENNEAKRWRKSIAIHITALLRITIAAIQFGSSGLDPWSVVPESCRPQNIGKLNRFLSSCTDTHRIAGDEALRAPLICAAQLRSEIMQARNATIHLTDKLRASEELRLLSLVTDFCVSYHGLTKLITTPFPFPLVQESRTILFFWIFTLPATMTSITPQPFSIGLIVFFLTFGFVGLEYVSIELDDPFGSDPNDFDCLGMGQKVFEDLYLTLLGIDGKKWADEFAREVSF